MITNFDLTVQEWILACLLVFCGGILANILILLHTANSKRVSSLIIQLLFSKSLMISLLFCLFNFVFVVALYGFGIYAFFIACVLFLFFVMSCIDWVLLAIPDWINFLCFFGIFVGLYYLDALGNEHFISAFCVAGGLSVLRVFGSFVFKKEILGEADIIVFASMGALLSIYASLYLIVLACFLAMGYVLLVSFVFLRGREIAINKIKVPFVVFLSLAFVMMLGYLEFGGSFV